MGISTWLYNHYKKRFDPDDTKGFTVLSHTGGDTYNDGGHWYETVVRCDGEILRIYMPTDYRGDDLEVTKMKVVMRESYEPV